MVSVGILDPNAVYALGLNTLVERCGIGHARVWHEVAEAARSLAGNAVDCLVVSERLIEGFCAAPIDRGDSALIVTVDGKDNGKLAAVRSIGFDGLLLRDSPEERIVECLRTVVAGHAWLDPELYGRLFQAGPSGLRSLSKRELEIASLAADGLSNKHIARVLNLSDGTVKIHLHHVFAKLHVSKRCELRRHLETDSPTSRLASGPLQRPFRIYN